MKYIIDTMCLMKRREPCLACCNISICKMLQDGIDDDMLDENISEGEYLKVMNQLKEMYDRANSYHKKSGCDDCEEEEEEDDSVEVEHFYWRGTDYFIQSDINDEGIRYLFNIEDLDEDEHVPVGRVDSTGLVHIY